MGWEVLAKSGESSGIRLGSSHNLYKIAVFIAFIQPTPESYFLTPAIAWILHNACSAVLHLGFDLEAEQLRKYNKTQVIKQDLSVCVCVTLHPHC